MSGTTQTVQILSALVTSHNAYTSTNETKIVQIKMELIFLPGGDAPRVVHACLDAMLPPQSALKLFANFTHGTDGSKHEKVQKKGDFPKNLHIACPCHYDKSVLLNLFVFGSCFRMLVVTLAISDFLGGGIDSARLLRVISVSRCAEIKSTSSVA